MFEDTIFYISHPYSADPEKSYAMAVEYTMKLRKMGLFPFSPILHTHHYSLRFLEYPEMHEDYVKWDIGLLLNFKKAVLLVSGDAFHFDKDGMLVFYSEGCKAEYYAALENRIPVYVLEDLLEEGLSFFST